MAIIASTRPLFTMARSSMLLERYEQIFGTILPSFRLGLIDPISPNKVDTSVLQEI